MLHVPARGDYAVRALVALALTADEGPRRGDHLAAEQAIPQRFLETVLAELRTAGILAARRGQQGGYWLARPAEEVSVLDVLEAIGAVAASPARGGRSPGRGAPGDVDAEAVAGAADQLWSEVVRANRAMLGKVSIADVARRAAIHEPA